MTRRRRVFWVAAVVAAVGVVAGLALFQPWKLWVDETVDEPPPAVVMPSVAGAAATVAPSAGPALLAQGTFIGHEHATPGTGAVHPHERRGKFRGLGVCRDRAVAFQCGPDLLYLDLVDAVRPPLRVALTLRCPPPSVGRTRKLRSSNGNLSGGVRKEGA